jgi:hypothetical protein
MSKILSWSLLYSSNFFVLPHWLSLFWAHKSYNGIIAMISKYFSQLFCLYLFNLVSILTRVIFLKFKYIHNTPFSIALHCPQAHLQSLFTPRFLLSSEVSILIIFIPECTFYLYWITLYHWMHLVLFFLCVLAHFATFVWNFLSLPAPTTSLLAVFYWFKSQLNETEKHSWSSPKDCI